MIELVIYFLKWSLVFLISVLLAGFIYERYARWTLEKQATKGKTFVEINGVPLHYVKKGQGKFTVVFQSGMGSSHAIWQEIQDSVSQNAVTISYDRNGIMFSKANGQSVTNDQVSEELEMLLEKTNCPKPYILVGHSMAGIYLRPFIKRNEKDIKGILFAEAAHPKQIEKASPELLKALNVVPPRWLIDFVINTGIYRTVFSFLPLSPEIPMQHPLHQIEKDFFYKSYDKVLKEVDNDKLNFKDAEQYNSFGSIPLTVITGTSEIRYAKIKDNALKNEYKTLVNEVQHDLLKLSSNSRFVEAENSGHILQISDKKLLIEEIEKICNQ